jgi:hypothetical protein
MTQIILPYGSAKPNQDARGNGRCPWTNLTLVIARDRVRG